ncbi:hypothetical protein ACHAWT_003294 [Skeletonema menzelii]
MTDDKTIIEPTFRTEPEEAGKLYPSKAKAIADEILSEKLENKSADAIEFEFEEVSKAIADEVKEKIKASLHIPRYKVLVQATIGTMKDQGVKITSRCLWDTSTDNYATASFQNEFIFASVLVFFLYTD